jgi:hypothetical protein
MNLKMYRERLGLATNTCKTIYYSYHLTLSQYNQILRAHLLVCRHPLRTSFTLVRYRSIHLPDASLSGCVPVVGTIIVLSMFAVDFCCLATSSF